MAVAAFVIAFGLFTGTFLAMKQSASDAPPGSAHGRLNVAIIGDSDSHSYRDSVNGVRRGGQFHEYSWNWVEIWDRLRSSEINLGPFIESGTRTRYAFLWSLFGMTTRTPRKLDFKHNYALSGLGCRSLQDEWPYQGKWLLDQLRAEPDAWRDGLVIIRIGVNDLGQRKHLLRWAITGADAKAHKKVNDCVTAIRSLVHSLRNMSSVHIAIVGIAHDYNYEDTFEIWQDVQSIRRISEVLTLYDDGLRSLAAEKSDIVFVDDTTWFRSRFGDRLTRDLQNDFLLAESVRIINKVGNNPQFITLADDHAGSVAGALFLSELVHVLNQEFVLSLTPIMEEDVLQLIMPALKKAEQEGRSF
jgi:lysophospholipase L1-like esterase